ncbi:MAG TPA: hypothetical protein VHH73_00130 [Verrucomicrobiae bacterium]|nr:hypothetical protein [Verrucomicrobiae bacterium]
MKSDDFSRLELERILGGFHVFHIPESPHALIHLDLPDFAIGAFSWGVDSCSWLILLTQERRCRFIVKRAASSFLLDASARRLVQRKSSTAFPGKFVPASGICLYSAGSGLKCPAVWSNAIPVFLLRFAGWRAGNAAK